MAKNCESIHQKRSSSSFKFKKNGFKELFVVLVLGRCLNMGTMDREQYQCAVKVACLEWEFWCDQKSERKVKSGPVDEDITAVPRYAG